MNLFYIFDFITTTQLFHPKNIIFFQIKRKTSDPKSDANNGYRLKSIKVISKPPEIPRFFTDYFELHEAFLSLFKSKTLRDIGGCILYAEGDVYRQVTKTENVLLPNGEFRKVNEYVHRMAAMCKYGIYRIPENYEASHRCGRSNCIRVEHLTLEEHKTNCDRSSCHREGIRTNQEFCFMNHGIDSPICLLPPVPILR